MMSNTKLSDSGKSNRKDMLHEFFAAQGQVFNFDGLTVAIRPVFAGSNMTLVSTSCASPDEQKLRRKVGEYFALKKMGEGEFMQVPLDSCDFENFAFNLAGSLGYDFP